MISGPLWSPYAVFYKRTDPVHLSDHYSHVCLFSRHPLPHHHRLGRGQALL